MSHLKTSLNNFLNTKKFTRKDKRSISRNNSERSLDNMKNSFTNKKIHQNHFEESPKRNNNYENEEDEDYYETKQPVIRKIHSIQEDYQPLHRKQLIKSKKQESEEQQYEEPPIQNKYHHQAESFQSSKRQSKTFVESLSRKINLEIGKINNTIEEFNRNLRRTIDTEYSKLTAAIKNAVESVIEGQQDNIKRLAKMQQKSVNQQLSQIRGQLESMYSQLEKYKDQLDGPNWKKTTGLLLSSDIESSVNELIKRSDKMKSIKNFKMVFDPKKQQAFGMALQQLLQVSLLSGGLENSRLNMGLVM